MFDSAVVLLSYICYLGLLFVLALFVERRTNKKPGLAESPLVYTLSLAVYCTAWTYYGSVGSAAQSGLLFLTIYIGPTIAICLYWIVVRRMVHIKREHRITSIADFLSARYGKSQRVAALASLLALVGTVPYIALQLESILNTFNILTRPTSTLSLLMHDSAGPILVCLIILFTIIFGVRRIDPTERHKGMIAVVAVESVVKLTALLSVGIFVTYFLYDGFGDVLGRAEAAGLFAPLGSESGASYVTWTSYLILAISAILFLPRQFHVTVVENPSERHILTAMWMFPLYLLLINIFVVPIAMGGLLAGLPADTADTFVLALPLKAGKPFLALFVFLGGVSAAMSMIMITSMTMAVMTSNHLLLPLIDVTPGLSGLRRHLLILRWFVVAGFILIGYWFYRAIGQSYMLVNIGIFSFAAVLQFAPAAIAGLFWRKANQLGALLGMGAGFALWLYTLILPSFIKSGWSVSSMLETGPFGISFLRPEQLFGVSGLDPISHAVFWTMFFNIGLFVTGSLLGKPSTAHEVEQFTNTGSRPGLEPMLGRSCSLISIDEKLAQYRDLYSHYFAHQIVEEMLDGAVDEVGLSKRSEISLLHLTELHRRIEQGLAGAIGSAAAHKAVETADIFSEAETVELTTAYGEMLAEMKVSPEELKGRIDYYQEREVMLTNHSHELETRILERDREIRKRRRIEEALRQARRKYRDIFENAVEGIFQTNLAGEVINKNPAFLSLTGYDRNMESRAAVTSFPRHLLVSPWDWEQFVNRVGKEGSTSGFETSIRKQDGSILWVHLSGRLVYERDQTTALLDGAIQDVNEQKRAREEIFKLNAELEQRVLMRTAELESAMRELESFSYSVSHDLRAPLRAIDGFSQVLVEDYGQVFDEESRDYFDRIRRATQRMGDIIDDILHLSQVSRSEMNRETMDISAMVSEILEEMAERFPARHVAISIAEGATAFADPRLVRLLLENLLSNAWKFTSKANNAKIQFNFFRQEGKTVFHVQDNGAGFDMQYAGKLFGAFNRLHTPDEFEGTGIGLAIVNRVVQRHGGYIRAEGSIGSGSTFYFTLET